MLGYIECNETFGDISFLQGEGATVSVIADDDNVRIPLWRVPLMPRRWRCM